jgi:hypothetical protein
MKPGANFEDRNRIREWAEQGKDPEFISQALNIEVKVVRAFMPDAEAEMDEELDGEDGDED